MNLPVEITRELAMEYFVAYAKFENVYLDESIKIDNENKIRGKVGAAEFEYRNKEKIFIVRGLIDKDLQGANPKFMELLLDTLLPLKLDLPEKLEEVKFEYDVSAYELQKDYPERINLRLDFTQPVKITTFVQIVDLLMDETYRFKVNRYSKITDQISDIVFPRK